MGWGATKGACKGCTGGEDTTVNFIVESATVCGFIELCKASCSFGGKVYMILVMTITISMEGTGIPAKIGYYIFSSLTGSRLPAPVYWLTDLWACQPHRLQQRGVPGFHSFIIPLLLKPGHAFTPMPDCFANYGEFPPARQPASLPACTPACQPAYADYTC